MFVTATSACVAMSVVTLALLLARLVSLVSEVISVVLVIVVPAGELGNSRNTKLKLAEVPAGSTAMKAASVLPGAAAPNGGPESWASEM